MGRATFHQTRLLSLAFSWKHILGSWFYMLEGYFAFGICSSYVPILEDVSHPLLLPNPLIGFSHILMSVFMTEDTIVLTWFVLSKITLAITYAFLNFSGSWLWIAIYALLSVIAVGIKVKLMSFTPFPSLSKTHAMFLFSSLPEFSTSFPSFKTPSWFCQYYSCILA